jgi:hypothetical protein
MAGSGYKAEQADDGTWTIYNVPVFSVHVDERESEPVEFTEQDLVRRFNKMKLRNKEGYLAPLHIDHHGQRADVKGAGYWRVRSIEPFTEGGVTKPTLFVDFVGVREEVYQRIRKGELQYRSVEILDINDDEIDSIALLDDEVPYFRYPLLKIADEIPASFETYQRRRKEGAVLAFSAAGTLRRSLCKFSMGGQMEPSEAPEEKPDNESRLSRLEAMVAKIAKKLGADEEEEEPEEYQEEIPVEQPEQVGMSKAANLETQGEIAALRERLKATEAKFAAIEADRAIETEALSLSQKGFSADVVNEFKACARKDGLVAARGFSRGLAKLGPSEPPRTWEGEQNLEIDPPEVAAYAASGPAALDTARELYRSHKRLGSPVPLKTFIETNLNPKGFFAKAHAGN